MDHYQTFGVSRDADGPTIKKAFRKLAMKHHPDKGGDEQQFKEIQKAYETLSDPQKRAEYDNPNPFEGIFQGGDPFGNGTGSAPGTLRSEHSLNEYREGAVGIASAGKDTESCQFFITHNPTPHLNGRYSIIGYVVEGMDAVHKIQVNDKILKVELFN